MRDPFNPIRIATIISRSHASARQQKFNSYKMRLEISFPVLAWLDVRASVRPQTFQTAAAQKQASWTMTRTTKVYIFLLQIELIIILKEYKTSWTSSIFRTCPDTILQNVLICFALSSFFHGIVGGPYVSLLLSRVPANTKVVTFGLMHLGMKIIGYAPGPFFAGSAIGKIYCYCFL